MELQWPLILFPSFLAWSAGVFGAQGVYALRSEAKKAQFPALITSFVLMVVGGIAVGARHKCRHQAPARAYTPMSTCRPA